MIKKKENKKNNCWFGITLIIITILIVGGIIYYKMPKQVCHDEIETELIEIGHYDYTTLNKLVQASIKENDRYLCENGVRVSDLRLIGVIWFEGKDKTCIIEHVTKVCEIVYK